MSAIVLTLIALGIAVVALLVAVLRPRGRQEGQLTEVLSADFQKALAELGQGLGQTVGGLTEQVQVIVRQQEALRGELVQVREQGQMGLQTASETLSQKIYETQLALAKVTELVNQTVMAQTTLAQGLTQAEASFQDHLAATRSSLQQEIAHARELLVHLKSVEEERERRQREAAEVLRRIEAVIAGSKSRGEAGENILGSILMQFPADQRAYNVSINNQTVEFAIKLPQGKILPIDSKWPSMEAVERLASTDDPALRKGLIEAIQRDLKKKVKEAVKYLDPEKTIGLGIVAVPDAVYAVCAEAHVEAYQQGIVIIGYTQAVPFLLSLLQVILRFSHQIDTAKLSAALRDIADSLGRMEGELEGRFADALKRLENSRTDLKAQVLRARQSASSLYLRTEEPPLPSVEP